MPCARFGNVDEGGRRAADGRIIRGGGVGSRYAPIQGGVRGGTYAAIVAFAAIERRSGDVAQQAVDPWRRMPPVPAVAPLRRFRPGCAPAAIKAAPAIEQQLDDPLNAGGAVGVPGSQRAALHECPQVCGAQLDAHGIAKRGRACRQGTAAGRCRCPRGVPEIGRRGFVGCRPPGRQPLQRICQALRSEPQGVQAFDQRGGMAAAVAQCLLEQHDLAAQQGQQGAQPARHFGFAARTERVLPVALRSTASRRFPAAHPRSPLRRAEQFRNRDSGTIVRDLGL